MSRAQKERDDGCGRAGLGLLGYSGRRAGLVDRWRRGRRGRRRDHPVASTIESSRDLSSIMSES